MEENETSTGKRLSWPIIAGFIVVLALILVGLFLLSLIHISEPTRPY